MIDNVLEEDFKNIVQSNIDFDKLRNTTILITGATGFIGSLLIKSLLYCSKHNNLDIKLIALVRSITKASLLFAQYSDSSCLGLAVCDLACDEIEIDEKIDYIIHCASVTTSKIMIEKPTDVIRTSVNGTDKILQLAVNKNVKSVVYLSSMEVYGTIQGKADETKLGYVDLSSVRSCYPESKRMCECLCNAYASQFGLNIKIARLAQTFGAGILPNENRVFVQFAKSVINKTNIVLHTRGESEGNYVYSSDAVVAILMLLLYDTKGVFNICNEDCHMTIAEMANTICREVANDQIKVVYDISQDNSYGYAPTTKLFLDSSKLKELGWKAQVGMVEAYKRLISYMNWENIK